MTASVKFWGVRGSIACPSPQHLGYSGNTSCVEVTFPAEDKLIFDCGTGIHNLGTECLREGSKHVNILLSHTHWDHINGFPFFKLAYDPAFSLHIMAGHLHDKGGIEGILATPATR